jgi:glutamine amidotransferase-like uncharacterized protein
MKIGKKKAVVMTNGNSARNSKPGVRLRAVAAFGLMVCAACGGAAQAGAGPASEAGGNGSLVQPWETFGPDNGGQNVRLIGSRVYLADALIYNGVGTANLDAQALAQIVSQHGLTYRLVDSEELNAMSLEELSNYGVMIWPGGYAGQMTSSLHPETRQRIREAVNLRGVSYVGFCAGAFMAVSPAPSEGGAPDWGLSLISGEILPYYYLEDEGVEYSMVPVSLSSGPKRDLIWWGGPTFPRSARGAVGRYPNGEAAIVEGWAGNGFVVLSAPHPEAPSVWRDNLGLSDADGSDWDLAWDLIRTALDRKPLPTL